MGKFKDYYEVLGIPYGAHARVIEEKYWEQAHELHQEPTKKAARRLSLINEAYETLGSPYRRAAYDRRRQQQAGQDGNGRRTGVLQSFVNLVGKAFRPD